MLDLAATEPLIAANPLFCGIRTREVTLEPGVPQGVAPGLHRMPRVLACEAQ